MDIILVVDLEYLCDDEDGWVDLEELNLHFLDEHEIASTTEDPLLFEE